MWLVVKAYGLVMALLVAGSAAPPLGYTEVKSTAFDGATKEWFGYALAIEGDRIVVGTPNDADNGTNSGSAFVLEPDGLGGWTQTKLLPSDGFQFDRFGRAVAISGGRIVIGSPFDDDLGDRSGSAYVFEDDGSGGWTETKLIAPDGLEGDRFGSAVAIAGDLVVVGSPFHDVLAPNSGAAYVFEPDGLGGWTSAKLSASDGGLEDWFGGAVAASGERLVVGSPRSKPSGPNSGSAYVFDSDGSGGWTETKLSASDGAIGDWFGFRVTASGDSVAVSSPRDADNGMNSGSVYLFESDGLGGWSETKFIASDGEPGDGFGWSSIDIEASRLVVGAQMDDDLGTSSGSMYLYESDGLGGWTETKFLASDGSRTEAFGGAVAVSENRVVGGSPFDSDLGFRSGSVYVFEPTP